MAENPKQRFRRVLNDLSQDDRTFIDSSLRRIYSESLSYGLKNNFLTKDEVVKYQNLGQQRDAALRKVNVLDPQGQPISKETTVPVMRNGQIVQEKRVTPVTPFDLLRKTGGQMEGGPADGPLFTGYTLDTQAPLGTARKKFQEEVIPTAQKAAAELERTKGETKFFQPGTLAGLTAGAVASVPVGAFKAVTAPLASAVSRGVGLFNPEASRAMDTALAEAYYPKATVDVSQPFRTGLDVGEIAGTKFAEAIPASLAALTAGSAAAIPASIATTPIGGAIAGTAVGLGAAAATGQAQNFLTEFALGSSYKPSEKGFGFDIQRSPLSQARAEFMSERTELAPSAAFAGEFAPNLLMGTPTLPKGFVGGLKSGYQATRLGTAGRQALAAASVPTEGIAGRLAATPLAQVGRSVGQKLERIPGVGAAATFGRGFSASPAGQEFLSDIAERGTEGAADLYLALKGNSEKPESERDPLWKILGVTALGSMFEGQHRLGNILNAPGQKIGKSIVRGMDARLGTVTPFAYEGLTPTTTEVGAGGISTAPITAPTPRGRVSGTSTPLPTLPTDAIPIGGGRVARFDVDTRTSFIEPAPPVDIDRSTAVSPSIGTNVLNALTGVSPKFGDIVTGTYGRVGTTFGRVQSKGGESQLFLGLTHDGLAIVKATDKKTGESSVDLISPDLLIGDNKRIANKAFKSGNLLPSDKTGYQRKGYDAELNKASSYIPTSEGDGPSFDDFDREIKVSGTPFYGRVVKAIDANYSVVQVPSPVSGFDMLVVPNDTVEGLKRGEKSDKVAREVLDTTAMNIDMSAYRVDRTKHDPLFKDTDRTTVRDEVSPILLTPDQMSDVGTRKTNIRNYRNQLRSEGLPDGTINDRLREARRLNNKEFDKTIKAAVNDYEVGTLIDHVAPSGEIETAVVVANTKFGPTVVSTTNPSAPAYTVQESAITGVYSEVAPTEKVKPESKKAEPKAAEDKKTSKKKSVASKVEPVVTPEVKPEPSKVEAKTEVKPEAPKEVAPKPEVKSEVKAEPKPEVKPEVKAEEKPKPVVEAKPEVKVEPTVKPVDTDADVLTAARILFDSKDFKISNIQNQMKIGFTKASRLLDRLADAGVIKIITPVGYGPTRYETIVSRDEMESILGGKSKLEVKPEAPKVEPSKVEPKAEESVKLTEVVAPPVVEPVRDVTLTAFELPTAITSRLRKIKISLEAAVNAQYSTRLPSVYAERNPTPENIATRDRSIASFNTTAKQYLYEVNKVLDLLSGVKTNALQSLSDGISNSDDVSIAESRAIIKAVDDAVASLESDYLDRNKPVIWSKYPEVAPRFESVGKAFDSIKSLTMPEPKVKAPESEVTPIVEDKVIEGPVTGFGVENPKDVAQLTGEKRFELGKKLNKEQRDSILKRVGDSYKDQRHQKEFAGLDSRGEETYRYPYSTEHMYVSNITGKFIRYYVVIPSDIAQELTGVKRDIYAHPSELFPDITTSKAVDMARMTKSKELRELIAEAESNGFITEDESRTAINILPSYVEDKAKPNRTKTIEDIIRKAERINEPNEEVDVLEKAIRDNAKDGIPEFLDAKMLANFAEGKLARTYAFKDINGLPIRQFPGVVTAAKARIKREGATPEVEAPKVNPVVKETAIETADLISEPIFTPEEEGSELNTTLPGDVEILDDPSLVRIQASIEGLGNINDVFRKARNVGELQQTLVNVITDANQGINPAEAQKYATAISQYYDEWIHAFVNRDLLLAQQLAQGVTAFKSAAPSGDAAEYSIFEQPIEEDMPYAKRKSVERQNRVARLYQSVDMPRLNNIIDMLNDEAGRKVVALNEEGKYQYLPINFFTKAGEGTALTPSQKADVVAKVQAKLVRERYRTNMPVFAVLSKAPDINKDFNDLFVGEGAYVNIRGNDTNIGQQVVFLTKNNSDPSTIVEELSHALLENMPIDMAREVATKLGKTLREPTSTNTNVTSYELQEMFAARMKLSFLTGEKEAFTGVQGSKATKKRLGEVWDTIQGFMRKAYGRMVDGTAIPADDKPKVEWVVPYNNQTVSLWDKAPILFRNNDGTLSRGVIQPTKKYPGGPGLVRDTMLEKPIVTVKTADGKTVDIAPKSVVALSDFISETPEFGKMMLTFMSGSSGQRGVSVVGLIDSYSKVTKALSDSTYEGLQGKVDEFIDDTDFKYRLDAAGDATQKANAETILKAEMPNRLLGIVNQAYKYGLLSDVSDNPSDSLSLQNWLNVVGVMRSGNGTTSDTFAKGKSTKMSAYDWYRSSINDLQKAIKDAEPYSSQLEIQGDYQRLNYNVDADNTGGNVLYSSRQVGDTPRINRALANGQSSNTNPDSQTPGDYAESATRSGMPRESVTPIVERRVIADADRSGLGNSNIRVMELNDVLVIDGTVGLSPVGIDTIGKAIDFAARNNIQNAILVSPATPSEDLGYNDRGGYTVNPSVTFEFENPVTDNMYAVMKRIYPYIRKGLDSRSVTLHNVEEVGKPYEESLNTFEQAVDKIAREISKRRIPVQAIQGAERIWHFGNQSAEGYAIPYYEARNVLHLLKPEIYETGREPIADKRVKSVLEDAISSVSGRSISLPNIDFASVPDNPERRIAMVDNYNRLPDNTYSTNPETKASYDSLMSELDRQFTYLGLSVSTTGSDTPSKFLLTPQPITKGHPLMANSKHKDVDGKPLRYIDILDAVHNSLSEAVKMVSAGEHSDLMAYAAHSAITKDAKALRALYIETLGRSSYETLTGTDVHKASLAPIEDSKTGIVALDKRVQSLYKDSTAPYGDLKKNEVNNAMGRVQYAAGSGTPIYSLRPISDAVISDTGEPDEASADNPVTVVAEDGTETIATSESAVSRILNFLDKNPVTKTLDVINALGRFPMAGDWSAPLVQNWMLANPIESPDLFFKSLMFGPKSLAPNIGFDNGTNIVNRRMFYGRKQVHDMGDVIRSNRFYELAKEANLNLATMEYDRILEQKRKEREEKLAQLRQRDPNATLPEIDLMDIDELDVDPDIQGLLTGERHVPLKAASERAMTMMKDFVKFNKFYQACEHYVELGYDPSSEGFKEMASDMAAILNVMNGDVKFTANEYDKAIGRLMRRVMFAPRWLTSRVIADPILRQAVAMFEPGKKWLKANGIPTDRSLNPYVMRANIRMATKAQAFWYALLAFFGYMRPFDQFKVQTSVGNMATKIQVGNYVFKAPGGSMMALEFTDSVFKALKVSAKDSPKEGVKKMTEMMSSFALGRIVNSPAIGIMTEAFTGRDFMGKPVGYIDTDLQSWWEGVARPTMSEIGLPLPDMKLSKFVTKNLMFLWMQSYLETYKMAEDRLEDDKFFEAGFIGAVSALGGRIRYNPPAGKGEYDYDTYGNPPGMQYYILGANREEWLASPGARTTPEQIEAMEQELLK